jgi:starch-binding outer membrane protein, SusD/RagB family
MKKYLSKIKYLLWLLLLPTGSCSDLDEEQFGSLSPNNYYQNEEEALSSVVGVYQRMAGVPDLGDPWRISELGTDEFIVPARTNGGWFDGGIWIEYITHEVKPTNVLNGGAWTTIFGVVGAANAVIQSLQEAPKHEEFKALIAETRALRAYAYFYALDYWGNVPIFTEARINPQNLPATNARTEVFNFVEAEMLQALADLPSIKDVNRTSYYPRFTREAIQAALATLYLNSEVYTGTATWAKAIAMCDAVINSEGYRLEPDLLASFRGNNHTSQELISSFSLEPALNAGGNAFILYTLHPLTRLVYNLPFTPANGYSTFQEALDRYEANDIRRSYLFHGPQTYPDGRPLVDPATNRQLTLIPVQNYRSAEDNEGYKVLKYIPDGSWVGFNDDNDLVLMRYSDILLTKAEALFRTGSAGEARDLVNQVRGRSKATPLTALTLKDLEEERAREFIWEGHRRRDMIRFGTYFSGTWQFKNNVTPAWKGIYPIPNQQIIANPKLVQNPNY